MAKQYPTKAPYQKTSNKKPFENIAKIFPSRHFSAKLEHRIVSGKKGKHK
jgi:hypothetical protein